MLLPALIDDLEQFYGSLAAPPSEPFAVFVWEALSVHSTARKRDAAFASLKRNRLLTPDAIWRAPQKRLEESVALAGPYLEQRLRALRAGSECFRRAPDLARTIQGPLRDARRAIELLPRISTGGASRMLLFAAGRAVFPVDQAVARVVTRLGDGEQDESFGRTVRSVRTRLTRELPNTAGAYSRAFLYLSHHAAATCTGTRPHCSICPVKNGCEYFRLQISD